MIASEAEKLIYLIDHKSQLQQNVSHRAGFRTRFDELQGYVVDLEQRTAAVKAFTDRNFPNPDVSNKAFAVFNQITTIAEGFYKDPGSIISLNNVVLKNALKSLNNELDQYISESWREYTNRARQTNQQDLEGLSLIPTFAGIVQKVRILLIQIDSCRKSKPTGEEDFEKFDQLVADIEDAWSELGPTDIPAEVTEFLRAAGSRDGASIDLLTTTVKEWLTVKEINNSFRIHMGSSGI